MIRMYSVFSRLLMALAVTLCLVTPALSEASDGAAIEATDILGRKIVLAKPARRIVLSEGRHMAVLGLLHDDPVSLVTGWRLDKALDDPTMQAYREKFPQIDTIRTVGSGNRGLSVETVIALKPDLMVMSLMDSLDPAMDKAREQIESAGIPVAYVDFFARPRENSLPSLKILGELTGATERAAEFAEFYQQRLDRVRTRLAKNNPEKPSVFFHVHAAPTNCCSTVGQGVFDDFVNTAGGQNIAAETVKAVQGNVSLEFLISADPDIYIGTGGTHMAARGGLVLGSEVGTSTAEESFNALITAPGLSSLRAVREGHAAGIWHLFNDTPAHIALIEYLAKLFHPDLFADLDPDDTLRQINTRFLPVNVPGTFWIQQPK